MTNFDITAKRGLHGRYHQRVTGEDNARLLLARLSAEGWHDCKARPMIGSDAKQNFNMAVCAVCVLGLVLAMFVGMCARENKWRAFESARMEVGK